MADWRCLRRLTAMGLLVAAAATAGGNTVHIGARVVPFFVATATFDRSSVEVTPSSREAFVVAMVMVRTNDPAGYLVQFDPDPAVVKSLEIEGLSGRLRATGGAAVYAVEPLTTVKTTVRELRITIEWTEDVPPGRRSLPFVLSLRQMTP